jgi:hypothetical protein
VADNFIYVDAVAGNITMGSKDLAGVHFQKCVFVSTAGAEITQPLTDTQLRATPVPVSGTFWQATQPVSGTFWQATQPVSAAALPLPADAASESTLATLNGKVTAVNTGAVVLAAGTAAVGKLAANSGVDIGDVDVTSITPPTLTKGTQGATGFSVQDLKDAGRTTVTYTAVAAAAGTTTTETAITLQKSAGTAATSTAASFVITSGKRFRITHITFATRGHNTATAQTTTFNLRVNTAGAVTTSSTPIIFRARAATPATANAWDRATFEIPDGLEILGDGTLQFGVTAAATYTTYAPTWDVTIIGFEY